MSVLVGIEHTITLSPEAIIGVDMGVKNIAILSDGTKYPPSDMFRKYMDRVSKEQ